MPETKLHPCGAANRHGDPCVINHAHFPDTPHTSAWGIHFWAKDDPTAPEFIRRLATT